MIGNVMKMLEKRNKKSIRRLVDYFLKMDRHRYFYFIVDCWIATKTNNNHKLDSIFFE